ESAGAPLRHRGRAHSPERDGAARARGGQRHRGWKSEESPRGPGAALEAAGQRSEPLVVGSATAFGRGPGDDLVGIGDVAGLAVNAVRGVDLELELRRAVGAQGAVRI